MAVTTPWMAARTCWDSVSERLFKANYILIVLYACLKQMSKSQLKLAKSKRDLIPFFPDSWQPYQDSVAGCWYYTTAWGNFTP